MTSWDIPKKIRFAVPDHDPELHSLSRQLDNVRVSEALTLEVAEKNEKLQAQYVEQAPDMVPYIFRNMNTIVNLVQKIGTRDMGKFDTAKVAVELAKETFERGLSVEQTLVGWMKTLPSTPVKPYMSTFYEMQTISVGGYNLHVLERFTELARHIFLVQKIDVADRYAAELNVALLKATKNGPKEYVASLTKDMNYVDEIQRSHNLAIYTESLAAVATRRKTLNAMRDKLGNFYTSVEYGTLSKRYVEFTTRKNVQNAQSGSAIAVASAAATEEASRVDRKFGQMARDVETQIKTVYTTITETLSAFDSVQVRLEQNHTNQLRKRDEEVREQIESFAVHEREMDVQISEDIQKTIDSEFRYDSVLPGFANYEENVAIVASTYVHIASKGVREMYLETKHAFDSAVDAHKQSQKNAAEAFKAALDTQTQKYVQLVKDSDHTAFMAKNALNKKMVQVENTLSDQLREMAVDTLELVTIDSDMHTTIANANTSLQTKIANLKAVYTRIHELIYAYGDRTYASKRKELEVDAQNLADSTVQLRANETLQKLSDFRIKKEHLKLLIDSDAYMDGSISLIECDAVEIDAWQKITQLKNEISSLETTRDTRTTVRLKELAVISAKLQTEKDKDTADAAVRVALLATNNDDIVTKRAAESAHLIDTEITESARLLDIEIAMIKRKYDTRMKSNVLNNTAAITKLKAEQTRAQMLESTVHQEAINALKTAHNMTLAEIETAAAARIKLTTDENASKVATEKTRWDNWEAGEAKRISEETNTLIAKISLTESAALTALRATVNDRKNVYNNPAAKEKAEQLETAKLKLELSTYDTPNSAAIANVTDLNLKINAAKNTLEETTRELKEKQGAIVKLRQDIGRIRTSIAETNAETVIDDAHNAELQATLTSLLENGKATKQEVLRLEDQIEWNQKTYLAQIKTISELDGVVESTQARVSKITGVGNMLNIKLNDILAQVQTGSAAYDAAAATDARLDGLVMYLNEIKSTYDTKLFHMQQQLTDTLSHETKELYNSQDGLNGQLVLYQQEKRQIINKNGELSNQLVRSQTEKTQLVAVNDALGLELERYKTERRQIATQHFNLTSSIASARNEAQEKNTKLYTHLKELASMLEVTIDKVEGVVTDVQYSIAFDMVKAALIKAAQEKQQQMESDQAILDTARNINLTNAAELRRLKDELALAERETEEDVAELQRIQTEFEQAKGVRNRDVVELISELKDRFYNFETRLKRKGEVPVQTLQLEGGVSAKIAKP